MEINEEKIKSLGDIFESTVKKNFHAYFSDEDFERLYEILTEKNS